MTTSIGHPATHSAANFPHYRRLLRAKIHRATITEANLDYEGSITVPLQLARMIDLVEYEAVHLWNVTSGTRLETYALMGPEGSSDICVNGAAAHLMKPGELVIIACFAQVPEHAVRDYQPKIVFVDNQNNPKELRREDVNNNRPDIALA
jgi:aspartate 1-decarboxylase